MATPTAKEETETDELETSHTDGPQQEQPGTALDDSSNKTTRCLRSLCNKLCNTTPTKDFTIGKIDFTFALLSLCAYIADIGTDIWVAFLHYQNDDIFWFALTLAFVFAPCLVMGVFFITEHHDDCKDILKAFTGFIPGGLLYWFIIDLKREWKIITEKDQQEKKRMSEDIGVTPFLRLFEAFLEAAPQLVLQLYIIYSNEGRQGHTGAVQWCSVCISLASLSLPVTTYYKMWRLMNGKYKVPVPGTALLIAFHIFTIGARVLSLAIVAVSSGYALLGVALSHCGVMYVWLLLMQNSNICDIGADDFAFNFGVAFIYLFCFIDTMNEYSRLRYAFFYTLTYIENIGILFFWYFYSPPSFDWQRYLACTSIMGGYLIGILCLVVYYVDFHANNLINDPKKKIKVLVPFSECQVIEEREEECPCCLCCK